MRAELWLGATLLLLSCCCCGLSRADQWAVLVAGSNTWSNYRHQADVCHAYQILHKWGIPDEHIIVFMYDDIAENKENPWPGTIINVPRGEDVYAGVPKDYTKKAVTPSNFIAVLTGDTDTLPPPNKVLKSGPSDHVFIYFADHGGTDLICFPDEDLTSTALNQALQTMKEKQMYGELTFYMEACESGSMFDKLLKDNINVYAQTAANPFQSSYACDYDYRLGTFTNDCWSITWMQDAENNNPYNETLQIQFEHVHSISNQSDACQYGDLTIPVDYYVSDFMADSITTTLEQAKFRNHHFHHALPQQVSSRDVDLALLLLQRPQDKAAIELELGRRALADARAERFYHSVLPWTQHQCERCDASCKCVRECYAQLNNQDLCSAQCCSPQQTNEDKKCSRISSYETDNSCYTQLLAAYQKHCGRFTSYSLQHARKLAHVCATPHVNVAAAIRAAQLACSVSL